MVLDKHFSICKGSDKELSLNTEDHEVNDLDIKTFKRIIIVGNSGSGKSYMGKKLSEITNLPLIHLDNVFWQPNWVKTPREEWIKKQRSLIEKEKWIIDGNYNSTLELRFEAADLVIFLDINRFVCLISAFRRHGKKRSDLPDYLVEKVDSEFFDFCKWIWSFYKTGKKKILDLHHKYPDKDFIVINNRKKLKSFLYTPLK
jgi:adenylate kinase family enzyme